VAAVDDAIDAVGALLERLEEARSATAQAVEQTDTAHDAAAAYGNHEGIAGCAEVKDELAAVGNQLDAVRDSVEKAQATLQDLRAS
jgi:hypothetical protein